MLPPTPREIQIFIVLALMVYFAVTTSGANRVALVSAMAMALGGLASRPS